MTRPGDLLTIDDVVTYTGLARSTIDSYRFPGEHRRQAPFPEPKQRFGNTPVWHRRDIDKWLTRKGRPGRPPTTKDRTK